MEISREDILREFEAEAEEHLDSMEQALVGLERNRDDEALLRGLFRSAHTLKGASACVGFSAMTQFAHALEDLLERLWQRSIPVSGELITLLLRAIDLWRTMVPSAMSGADELSQEQVDLLGHLARFSAEHRTDLKAPEPAPAETAAVETGATLQRSRTLRVPVVELDKLVTLTGEIAISRSRIGSLLSSDGARLDTVRDAHLEAERLYLELQEQVMKLRMVPVGPTFRQHIRTVRDVAVARGKQARLVLAGEDVEVDMAVLEALRDPLVHLVRNAIDHGIELPKAREEQGKDPVGTVALSAQYDSGSVEIQIVDDGRGLDKERILARGRELGLASAEAPASEEDVLRLIFSPGFSTAGEVTEISGRGIGLDIVTKNVELLRGTIAVATALGKGTTITMRVPLTLGVIRGFSVGVGSETYILPLESVVECLELPASERGQQAGQGMINVRGRALPYLRLRDLFGLAPEPRARESVVVVRHGAGQAGIAVDQLLGEGQTVVKPLGRAFRNIPTLFGSALLGDGRVALILDVPALMRTVVPLALGKARVEIQGTSTAVATGP